MKALAFEQVVPKGDLAYRMVKNYARLEGTEYRPEQIFDIDKNGWPGDWEGRTILALAPFGAVYGSYARLPGCDFGKAGDRI